MRRRWGARRFLDACQHVRGVLDDPCFTTDVIVGFPGETEEDFAATCSVAREAGFAKIHIFPFSARAGTPAAAMKDQVPADVKQQRCKRLAAIEQELRAKYLQRMVGRQLQVLVESETESSAGRVVGTACRYVPVEFDGDKSLVGKLVDVAVKKVVEGADRLFGL